MIKELLQGFYNLIALVIILLARNNKTYPSTIQDVNSSSQKGNEKLPCRSHPPSLTLFSAGKCNTGGECNSPLHLNHSLPLLINEEITFSHSQSKQTVGEVADLIDKRR